mmetsp:Transcript_11732/g.19925  ORF Transcript_11732/g.19925 Transcript_11732/m.19925 type:complete len:95 (-) Transcript_11732:504-788(-)
MSLQATKDIRNPVQLYRDCLRLVDYVSTKQGGLATLRQQVRSTFDANRNLTDPQAIDTAKEAAIRGLSNFFVHEAQVLAKKDGRSEQVDWKKEE